MTKPRKTTKARKVEEPAAAYGTPPAIVSKASVAKSADQKSADAEIQRLTDKIFTEQKELLRKLAQ